MNKFIKSSFSNIEDLLVDAHGEYSTVFDYL